MNKIVKLNENPAKFYHDLDILYPHSDLIKRIRKHGIYKIVTIFDDNENFNMDNNIGETGFHFTDKCGIIDLPDDYLFGIRCDHLMWAEGWIEHSPEPNQEEVLSCGDYLNEQGESITSDEKAPENENTNNAILIMGNHKGTLIANIITIPIKCE